MNNKDFCENLMLYKGCYILGPTGPRGFKGEPGSTPQLSIGTVITGPPGTNASVTITPVNKKYINDEKKERKEYYG